MRILIIVLAALIIVAVLYSFRTRIVEVDRISIKTNDMSTLLDFPDSELAIHYYSAYSGAWDVEVKNKKDRTVLTAKDQSLESAINQIKRQQEALKAASL